MSRQVLDRQTQLIRATAPEQSGCASAIPVSPTAKSRVSRGKVSLWRQVREGALAESDAQAEESRSQELVAASYLVGDIEGERDLARRLLRLHPLRWASRRDRIGAGWSRPYGHL